MASFLWRQPKKNTDKKLRITVFFLQQVIQQQDENNILYAFILLHKHHDRMTYVSYQNIKIYA